MFYYIGALILLLLANILLSCVACTDLLIAGVVNSCYFFSSHFNHCFALLLAPLLLAASGAYRIGDWLSVGLSVCLCVGKLFSDHYSYSFL